MLSTRLSMSALLAIAMLAVLAMRYSSTSRAIPLTKVPDDSLTVNRLPNQLATLVAQGDIFNPKIRLLAGLNHVDEALRASTLKIFSDTNQSVALTDPEGFISSVASNAQSVVELQRAKLAASVTEPRIEIYLIPTSDDGVCYAARENSKYIDAGCAVAVADSANVFGVELTENNVLLIGVCKDDVAQVFFHRNRNRQPIQLGINAFADVVNGDDIDANGTALVVEKMDGSRDTIAFG